MRLMCYVIISITVDFWDKIGVLGFWILVLYVGKAEWLNLTHLWWIIDDFNSVYILLQDFGGLAL